ncbi:hypothetical protein RUM44_010586 [Polyplax serrata]|uniref:Uncharacterized protein n=1 Tax=Polyplax serrata TaxID=468196 RepID=A0ABR1AVX8_POLSC
MVQPIFSAAIVMPEVTVFDNFHSFDETRKKIIMDCLFLCANYLVECVNAFCSRKEWDKGKKRKADGSASSSTAATQGDPHVSNMTPQIPAAPTEGEDWDSKVESDDPLAPYEGYFRLLHVNCVELLKAELTAKSAGISQTMSGILVDDKSWSPGSKTQTELQNDDALFLLEDCIRKTSEILGKSKGGFGFKRKTTSTATETCPEDFLNVAMSILPALMKKIATWSTYCKNLLNENEELFDGPGMYPKESCDIKMALAAAFQFLAGILAWHGFEIPVNKSILIEILGSLTKKGNSSNIASRVTLVSNVAADAACQLAKFSKSILLLNGGVCIIKAVQTCSGFSSVSSPNLLADLCLDMLRRPWFNVRGTPEKGATYNQQIDELLKTYFATVNDRLKVVKNTAKMAFDEMYLLNDRNSSLNFMKSLSRNNFPLLYRAMCQALVSASTEELAKNKNDESRLQIWNTIVEAMMTLVEIVKIHTSRINLAALLKNSQCIIQLFFSTGMPVIEGAFRVNSVDVLKLLKSLQTVTRFLHSICCHSKITSDSLVATYVPTIRAHCERLTLEVKGVLISNKIPMECITIAILKNKDLKGNDILSQESVEGDSDDDSELPTEDNDEDRDDGDNEVE